LIGSLAVVLSAIMALPSPTPSGLLFVGAVSSACSPMHLLADTPALHGSGHAATSRGHGYYAYGICERMPDIACVILQETQWHRRSSSFVSFHSLRILFTDNAVIRSNYTKPSNPFERIEHSNGSLWLQSTDSGTTPIPPIPS